MSERLTEKLQAYVKAYKEPPYGREVEGTVELLEEVLEKLAEYEDLEKQGLLVRFPCKVGDAVWIIVESYIFGDIGDKSESWYTFHSEKFKLDMIDEVGKTVFLTKEEAEEKLRELEGNTYG